MIAITGKSNVSCVTKLLIVFTIFISGCSTKRDLTVSDLMFADYEREAIALNNVDTIFRVAKSPFLKVGSAQLLSDYDVDTAQFSTWKFEDVGFETYDSKGRMVCNQTDRWKSYWFDYDSAGVMHCMKFRDWDVVPRYGSSYEFYPDSLVLHQQWYEQARDNNGPIPHHVSIFRFNGQGQLIAAFDNDSGTMDNIKRETYKTFDYENSRLKRIHEKCFVNDAIDYAKDTELYFSNTKLDSTVAITRSSAVRLGEKVTGTYKMTTVYDSTGLKQRSTLMDSVVIFYRHTKRKAK